MEIERAKASAFISRLLQNTALEGMTALQREEQIIQFLKTNAAQLYPTLSSSLFFPGLKWSSIMTLLINDLYGRTNTELSDEVHTYFSGGIDFKFIRRFSNPSVTGENTGKQVRDFMIELLRNAAMRPFISGPFAAIGLGIAERYLEEIHHRQEYIHFELYKVQRLRLDPSEVRELIRFSLILRPAVFSFCTDTPDVEEDRAIISSRKAEQIVETLTMHLPAVPVQVGKNIVNSCVSFQENRFIEASARFAAIMAYRSRTARRSIKNERGADTPDKSWFNIARKNYKYYGFDAAMLDELYKIAAENGW